MGAVGDDADLRPRQTDRLVPQRMDRHGHQRHADLFAGRQEHVHLPGRRLIGDLPGQVDQQVGIIAHGTDDHDDLVAFLLGPNGLSGCRENLLAVGDAGPTEFLDDDRHGLRITIRGSNVTILPLAENCYYDVLFQERQRENTLRTGGVLPRRVVFYTGSIALRFAGPAVYNGMGRGASGISRSVVPWIPFSI